MPSGQAEDLSVPVVEVLPARSDGEASAAPIAAFRHAGAGGHGGRFGPVDRFDDLVGPLDHMKRVETDPCLWSLLASDGQVDAAAVEADRLYCGCAFGGAGVARSRVRGR